MLIPASFDRDLGSQWIRKGASAAWPTTQCATLVHSRHSPPET